MVVQSLMYCAEQIVIPEKFQNILKTYAKAAIRTQPYDLLRWSAAYFRCMANNEPPPVKHRLEKTSHFGSLTKGYLRILLEQVGKGFFVNRTVLENRWADLVLPEEELFKFLSLCRMLYWSEIHWLKLFAVMVGSLNDNFKETVDMICELLTNEPEGGPNPIPMWMFRECYTFVAELDCEKTQQFENGRKVLNHGVLEEINPMPDIPKVLSVESFRNAIMERWNERIGVDMSYNPKFVQNSDMSIGSGDNSDVSSVVSRVSSSFRFIGDFTDPTEVIRKTPDFDSIILLLHEVQGDVLHSYNGPDRIDAKVIEYAKKKEIELHEQYKKQAKQTEQTAKDRLQAEHLELLKDIEPPWSWIHQFASQNCPERSFNFIECQSLLSNPTPPESIDESFDFERGTFISSASSVTTIESHDTCREESEKLALESEKESVEEIESEREIIMKMTAEMIDEIITTAIQTKIDLPNNDSIKDFFQSNVTDQRFLNMDLLNQFLNDAQEKGEVFTDLNVLHQYLTKQFNEYYRQKDEDKKLVNNPMIQLVISNANTVNNLEGLDDNLSMNVEQSPIIEQVQFTQETTKEPESSEEKKEPQIELDSEEELGIEKKPLEQKFAECDIEIDEKVLSKKVSDNMILGLTTPPIDVISDKESSSISIVCHRSSSTSESDTETFYISSDTTDIELSEPPSAMPKKKPPGINTVFNCEICPLPGIGRSVNEKTIQNFLTYLKGRSREEKGMVYPRHFRERRCPNMVDCNDI